MSRLAKLNPAQSDVGEDLEARRGIWRHLVLRHDGETFLERWGLDLKLFGIYLHHVCRADPGMDLHDHPWPFCSVILRGFYTEERADVRTAADPSARPTRWTYQAPAVNVLGRHQAHRIVLARPDTWTLVFRGRKNRTWGFFAPGGWVNYLAYDYDTRRPITMADTKDHGDLSLTLAAAQGTTETKP